MWNQRPQSNERQPYEVREQQRSQGRRSVNEPVKQAASRRDQIRLHVEPEPKYPHHSLPNQYNRAEIEKAPCNRHRQGNDQETGRKRRRNHWNPFCPRIEAI